MPGQLFGGRKQRVHWPECWLPTRGCLLFDDRFPPSIAICVHDSVSRFSTARARKRRRSTSPLTSRQHLHTDRISSNKAAWKGGRSARYLICDRRRVRSQFVGTTMRFRSDRVDWVDAKDPLARVKAGSFELTGSHRIAGGGRGCWRCPTETTRWWGKYRPEGGGLVAGRFEQIVFEGRRAVDGGCRRGCVNVTASGVER